MATHLGTEASRAVRAAEDRVIPFEVRKVPASDQPAGGDRPDQFEKTDEEAYWPAWRRLTCRTCAAVVANERDLVSITGTGPLVYVNPHGRVFELLTVQRATNVVAIGKSTVRFTWFAGYAWRVIVCSRCGTHLGWVYEAVEDRSPPQFVGLIQSAVTDSLD